MALTHSEAWVTYVTSPEHVDIALVLAHSLRSTLTTRRIAVIVSSRVSAQAIAALKNGFDHIFCLKHEEGNEEYKEKLRAKIFPFSLDIFAKCILLEPNTIVLENCDHVFESSPEKITALREIKNHDDISGDYLLLVPSTQLFNFLMDKLDQGNAPRKLDLQELLKQVPKECLRSQPSDDVRPEHLGTFVAQLSLENGMLLKRENWTPPSIVEFVGADKNITVFVERMTNVHQNGPGLSERAIVGMWLQLFGKLGGLDREPSFPTAPNEPIAIVGMSCRLPGANNLDEFWNLLYSGESAIRPPPSFRWRKEHVITAVGERERETEAGFLSTSVDEFDAKFFGISPKEAVFMDPQTRLMHELLWESLESGGIDPLTLQGTHTGIFTGSWLNDYRDIVQCSTTRDFFRTYMGSGIGAGAARLSFLLGLTGPSVATESGCSSAMVAVDMAVKSLRCGETNLALAGGVNLLLHPFTSKVMEYVIAPDGRCKTFDAKADGFGRAEGCGFLVLKRLSDALQDRDHVWALIRGSAITQEGLSRSLGTPTVEGEALAMKLALRNGGVRPEQVTHIEGHATGTRVGDPLEVKAIAQAYHTPNRKEPLVIGSVKTNVGHTESCSGITGIIKTVLSLQHELIPQHLNLETLNPEVDLEAIPAQIPLEPRKWPRIVGQPRLAGVSSFGITGTDGHVIIEEAPDLTMPNFTVGLERPLHLMKISARTKDALDQMLEAYRNALSSHKWEDVAHTANVGRASFEHRAFLLANGTPSAREILEKGNIFRGEVGEKADICFLFTGQGSQHPEMGRTLYETSPVFRFHFDKCDAVLRNDYALDIKRVLWGDMREQIGRTIYSQTSIFVVEYCLLKLWESWGIKPDVVVGHSLGEYCAAVCAGLLTLPQAIKLVAERSRLIDALLRGSMLVVKASQKLVQEIMSSQEITLDIAALNSAEQTVLAGDTSSVEEMLDACKVRGVKAVILEATHAFHSAHMNPILEHFRKVAQEIDFGSGTARCRFISGMEGVLRDSVNPDYWMRHTRDPVDFVKTCQTLGRLGVRKFVEVGPHPVLSAFVMTGSPEPVDCYPSLRKGSGEWETLLSSLGHLWVSGYPVDWQGYDKPYSRRKVAVLPHYPFQRKRFWVNCADQGTLPIHPLIGAPLRNASSLKIYENTVNLETLPYLKDHCIGSRIVFPGAAFTEMLLAAGYAVSHFLKDTLEKPSQAVALENVLVNLPESNTEGTAAAGFGCQVFHWNPSVGEGGGSDKWVSHATGTFHPIGTATSTNWHADRVRALIQGPEAGHLETFYKRVDSTGLKFGNAFRSLQQCWSSPQEEFGVDEVVTCVRVPGDVDAYLLHPLILDAMFQTQILAGLRSRKGEALRVPVQVGKLVLHSTLGAEQADKLAYIHAHWVDTEHCALFLCNQDLQPVAQMEGVELLETNVKTIQSVLEDQHDALPDCWEERWRPIPNGPHENRVKMDNVLLPTVSCAGLQVQLEEIATQEKVPDLEIARVNRLVTLYALRALLELGWVPQTGDVVNAAGLSQVLGITAAHLQQLVRFYFTAFRDELDFLEELADEQWKVSQTTPCPAAVQVDQEIESLLECLVNNERTAPVARIYQHVGENLSQVLQGMTNPLAVLFPPEDKLHLGAETYYKNHPGRREGFQKIKLTLTALSKKVKAGLGHDADKVVLRVLEVGAGTGSLSMDTLQTLKKDWNTSFEYYYTDISSSFFIKAELRLQEYKGQVKFAVFNIEEHPLVQGIPVNYFDLVMATDVLHACRDLRECVAHLRLVLRPGGLLFFTETVIPDKGITSVFGILEGYWRFQDREIRPHHACVSNQIWRDEVLLLAGFELVHFTPFYEGTLSMIIAEASNMSGVDQWMRLCQPPVSGLGRWQLFLLEDENQKLMLKVADILRASGYTVDLIYPRPELVDESEMLHTLGENQITGIIYAWGMTSKHKPQREISQPLLHIAQHLLTQKKPARLYVFTKSVVYLSDEGETNPTSATLWGMVKSLKNECNELFCRCVDLSSHCPSLEDAMDQVLHELAFHRDSRDKVKTQVAYRGASRWEPKFCQVKLAPLSKRDLQIPLNTHRYRLELPPSRQISELEFKPLQKGVLNEMEVEVQVRAYALNFRDLLAILKPSAEFESFNMVGIDFAGEVSKVPGDESKVRWKVGDRVLGINFNESVLHSHLPIKADSLVPIPEGLSFNEACTLITVHSTSLHCLRKVAQLQREETVLIHTGSGGVGLSAIQLAIHLGARVITTAGTARKRAYLRNRFGLEHVFHSRDTSFEQEILRVTNGNGVNVVLNSITGPGFKEATLNCCAQGSRFVEMSKLSIWTKTEVEERRSDVEYSIVDLTLLKPQAWKKMLGEMCHLINNGTLTSIPYVKFDAPRVRQALEYLQQAKHIGKVVVTMPPLKFEQGQWNIRSSLFDNESTYLVTGGLGGIGFAVGKWILEQGARDVVLTGRKPPTPEILAEIESLNRRDGVRVTIIQCDVGNALECRQLFQNIRTDLRKPLRGVHHCAGVLRDNLYPNQTWSSFETTFNAKVEGTWNLHRESAGLPLEQFVMYSSLTALLGSPGQSTHTAANCFEDAFAHYRHSLGLPATTINWGQWAQVGCARDANIVGVQSVGYRRMLRGLEEALRSHRVQTTFCEFESFSAWSNVMPTFKSYVDERLWLKRTSQGSAENEGTGATLQSAQFWTDVDAEEGEQEKLQVVSKYVTILLRKALRLEPGEPIKEDANLQDLGVDSLMLIELRNSIQCLLGKRLLVTADTFKNCQTIRQVSSALVQQIMDEGETENEQRGEAEAPLPPPEYEELLREDMVLDADITPQSSGINVSFENIRTVLITGVTGQLGPYILANISKLESVERIVCIVRTTSEEINPQFRLHRVLNQMQVYTLVDLDKVDCFRGDVSKPYFGLDEPIWQQLATEVDCVVHLATKSNHVEHYRRQKDGDDIRSQNVGATRNVLRFAVAGGRNKVVFYASSLLAVWGGGEVENMLPDNWPDAEDAPLVAESGVCGYAASKFVCELLLKQAVERGLPVKVFRYTWITGDSKTGQVNFKNNHYILRFLTYLKLKAMLSSPIPANILPVDICAEWSVQLFWDARVPCGIYNIAHPSPQLEVEFVKVARQEFGVELQLVDWTSTELTNQMAATGMPLEAFGGIYKDFASIVDLVTSGKLKSVRGYLQFPENYFVNTKLSRYLPDFGKNLPSTMEILKKDLIYARESGFFAKFCIE